MIRPKASANPKSLAARARGFDRVIGGLMLLAGALLVIGWTLPIMTVDRLLFLTRRVSILQGAGELWEAGHVFLFLVIVLFSIVFPLVKLIVALYLWYQADAGSPALGRILRWLEVIGRWSMLDVFAVALAVVAIQVSLISDVTLHAGIYVFTAAILLSLFTVQRITALARRAVSESQELPPPR